MNGKKGGIALTVAFLSFTLAIAGIVLPGTTNGTALRVYQNFPQNIPSGVFTKIDWNVAEFDRNNEFNLTSDDWTCTAEGFYLVTGCTTMVYISDQKKVIVSIHRDGVRSAEGRCTVSAETTEYEGVFVSMIFNLTVGEVIDLRVYHNEGVPKSTGGSLGSMSFAIYRLLD